MQDTPNKDGARLIAEALTNPFYPRCREGRLFQLVRRLDRWKIRYLITRYCRRVKNEDGKTYMRCRYCLADIPWKCRYSLSQADVLYEELFKSE